MVSIFGCWYFIVCLDVVSGQNRVEGRIPIAACERISRVDEFTWMGMFALDPAASCCLSIPCMAKRYPTWLLHHVAWLRRRAFWCCQIFTSQQASMRIGVWARNFLEHAPRRFCKVPCHGQICGQTRCMASPTTTGMTWKHMSNYPTPVMLRCVCVTA